MTQDWLWPDTLRVILFIAAIVSIWCVTGALRLRGRLRPADARKINHIAAFVGGSICFGWLAPEKARWSAFLAGTILLGFVFLACLFRERKPFSLAFAGNTRPDDSPHEAFYFWSSWLLSMLALLGIELLVWNPAVTRLAALVVGIGDGIAEPIGVRFGRHIYEAPAFWKLTPSKRSLEGSAALALATFFSVAAVLCFETNFDFPDSLATATTVTLGTTVVEAVTPHGFDNLTIAATVAGLLVLTNIVL